MGEHVVHLDEGEFNACGKQNPLAQTELGMDMVHQACTKLIQRYFDRQVPEGTEELVGSKFVRLFSDIHVIDDQAVSVFEFELPIKE